MRSSSPRPRRTGAGSQTRSSRPRSSPNVRGGGSSPARTRSELEELFDELGDGATVARLLNNLAGLEPPPRQPRARDRLARRGLRDLRRPEPPVDAGYVCSSLAEIRLEGGEPALSEAQARKALELLDERVDHLQEVGTAQLTLGRALAAQGILDEAEQCIGAADETFERARSASHRSSAWIAQGDVESSEGNDRDAAGLYRRAALALQEATGRAQRMISRHAVAGDQ